MSNIATGSFDEIYKQISSTKRNVYKSLNSSLNFLYFSIGKTLSEKVKSQSWGKGTVKELALYIKEKDPNIKGFSDSNLWRMKQFYETYGEDEKLATLWRVLTWSHNKRIMSLKTKEEREFYLTLSVKYSYSYSELENLITKGTYERTALADRSISDAVKDLPEPTDGIFKDSYILDFLDLPSPHKEKDLSDAIVSSLKEFILELGKGFAFIGQEYRVQVGNSDFKIDLLFFHRELKCLVAFELKTRGFKPADLGQLEFYLEALDQTVKHPDENPSIGILLCREKDDEVVKFALNRSMSPTVVAEYETKLIPKKILQRKLNEFYALLESEGANFD